MELKASIQRILFHRQRLGIEIKNISLYTGNKLLYIKINNKVLL